MTSHDVTLAGYVAFLAGAALLEVLAMRPSSRIPRLGVAVTRLMRTRSGRVALVAGWAWLGLHFFAR